MGGMIEGFGRITMAVDFRNLERILSFYINILEYKLLGRNDHEVYLLRPTEPNHVYLVPEEALEIKVSGGSGKARPTFIHDAEVGDVARAVALCEQMGFEVLSRWKSGDPEVEVKSPDGAVYRVRELPWARRARATDG